MTLLLVRLGYYKRRCKRYLKALAKADVGDAGPGVLRFVTRSIRMPVHAASAEQAKDAESLHGPGSGGPITGAKDVRPGQLRP